MKKCIINIIYKIIIRVICKISEIFFDIKIISQSVVKTINIMNKREDKNYCYPCQGLKP